MTAKYLFYDSHTAMYLHTYLKIHWVDDYQHCDWFSESSITIVMDIIKLLLDGTDAYFRYGDSNRYVEISNNIVSCGLDNIWIVPLMFCNSVLEVEDTYVDFTGDVDRILKLL